RLGRNEVGGSRLRAGAALLLRRAEQCADRVGIARVERRWRDRFAVGELRDGAGGGGEGRERLPVDRAREVLAIRSEELHVLDAVEMSPVVDGDSGRVVGTRR